MSAHPAATPGSGPAPSLNELTPELTYPQFDRPNPFDPPETYTELSSRCPVAPVRMPSGQSSWLITSFEGARKVLSDPRFSADMSRPGFPNLNDKPVDVVLKDTLRHVDGEEHMHYRRTLTGEFSVKRMEALRPVITQFTDDALDQLAAAGSGADLIKHVARVVPSRVVCHLIGVPFSDFEFFNEMVSTLMDTSSSADQIRSAKQGLDSYFDQLITDREHHDQDDLLGRMVRRYLATGELTREEVAELAWITLAGGQETTPHMIGLGVATLLRHPDQLKLLQQEPALLPGAMDELLRYLTVVHLGMPRVAVADVEIDGQTVAAGEGVVALLPLANRDPSVFERPNELDIRRNARQHLTFSYGPHQCPGHTLARLELEVVFGRLMERFPNLRLADENTELKTRDKAIVYGLTELAVAW